MTKLPANFIKFWNKNKHLNFGQAVQVWNDAGMSPKIKITK